MSQLIVEIENSRDLEMCETSEWSEIQNFSIIKF